ncbi:LysR family transcriptional regulator [Pacificoceanicola onchidii]|uniref:LysR substrate-binding domain-containing protein n=1 Tax=Pacificoceanicola onchidii TaxID=2562685 RepID=UPI0010A61E6E|nr:LysR family transcriptional regulator [Pacificoceanicola onchidii]
MTIGSKMRGLLARQLVHFAQIYDCKSIRAAGEVLGLSQPALSKSLKQLEEHLGVILFERRQGGVVPTAFGDVLRRRTNILDRELEYTAWEITALSRLEQGALKIGVGPVWSQRLMPRVLHAFCKRYPKISLSLEIGSAVKFVKLIEAGEVDLYFGGDATGASNTSLMFSPICDLALNFYAHEAHPIHQAKPDDFKQLEDYDWIGFSRQDDIAAIIQEYTNHPRFTYKGLSVQHESFETLAAIGQDGPYLVFAPDVFEQELAAFGIKPIPIKGIEGIVRTGMICRESAMLLEPIRFLLESSRTQFGETAA